MPKAIPSQLEDFFRLTPEAILDSVDKVIGEAMPGVRCYRPEGAFYVFAELPIDDADRFCRWLLEDFSYQNQTVMLAPGSGFYATPGRGLREVRFAYVLNTEDLNCAMDCLGRALEVYAVEMDAHASKLTTTRVVLGCD